MALLIIIKWCVDWNDPDTGGPAPSLIGVMIHMVLHGGATTDTVYTGQTKVEPVLLAIALISAPWMLLAKPARVSFLQWQAREQSGGSGAHGAGSALDSVWAAVATCVTWCGGARSAAAGTRPKRLSGTPKDVDDDDKPLLGSQRSRSPSLERMELTAQPNNALPLKSQSSATYVCLISLFPPVVSIVVAL
jgi:hypothetical protein